MSNEVKKKGGFKINWFFFFVIAMLSFMLFQDGIGNKSFEKEVSLSEFKHLVADSVGSKIVVEKNSGVARMVVRPQYVREVFKMTIEETGKEPMVKTMTNKESKIEELALSTGTDFTYIEDVNYLSYFMSMILPILLLVGLWYFIFRRAGGGAGGAGGGVFSVGKSKAKLFEKGKGTQVLFKDVAGQEGAKQEVQEIVDFLKNPAKYTELGGKIPKGALLVGPPGTGKTLLAKAVAGEANVPFFSLSGSDFVEMFVGVGASRVRDLFRQAKEKAPAIIFIDEIDAIGRARGSKNSFNSNDERENTLNQLLTEMDGFGSNSGIIILAATNRVEILDQALLRPGRFDRQIHLDLPELSERVAIFKVHLAPLKLAEGLDIEFLARQTPGFSGADIANVCNEAALIAARHNSSHVSIQDFLDAVDRTVGGLEKKTKVMTRDEKKTIALHEAGHAAISWLVEYGNPLVKITIIPRGRALGAAWYLPEERVNSTKEQILDNICSLLGGRAAEELFTGSISTGALSDLERATKAAYAMVAFYGMSDNLQNISYFDNQENIFTKPYSDDTAKLIDKEVKAIIATQYERAKALLSENAEKHNLLAEKLMEHEVVFAGDVEEIFGKRPWKSRADELLEEQKQEEERNQTLPSDDATPTSADDACHLSTTPIPATDTEALPPLPVCAGNDAAGADQSDPSADTAESKKSEASE
ncbi:MAG: ATP-dependent zinc metalloprotease FtsH [Bacteroidaceae bacterium]|nr:ATP-dependent zinc metalloprotease FtsH [Bacteroidaceae bacterium]